MNKPNRGEDVPDQERDPVREALDADIRDGYGDGHSDEIESILDDMAHNPERYESALEAGEDLEQKTLPTDKIFQYIRDYRNRSN